MERRAEAVAAAGEVVAKDVELVGGLPDAVRDRDALSDGALRGTRQLRDHVKRFLPICQGLTDVQYTFAP